MSTIETKRDLGFFWNDCENCNNYFYNSILFNRVTVNVLVFVLRAVFFHLIVYIVTRYMYDAVRQDFALSASFVLERFDGSELTTREGNELVVQKENCERS